VSYDGATGKAAPGWLTQGSIGGTPTTAKFYHKIPPGTANARARFSAVLPSEWRTGGLQDTGLRVNYGMKYASDYSSGRGSIQVCFPTQSYGLFDAYLRVRHVAGGANTMIQPRDNAGNAVNVDEMSLVDGNGNPRNISDAWHDWTAVVVYGEYADYGSGARYWTYWDLSLDGQQLLFTGTNGSPLFNGHTYSFRRFVEASPNGVSGDAYIGLGELNNQNYWNFECDYVNFANVPDSCSPDMDGDGDVDQMDFATFQLCYTGVGGGVPAGCECLNRTASTPEGIDATDFAAFNKCWTGPNVHFDPGHPPPGCVP
jgi:hypothetical protein